MEPAKSIVAMLGGPAQVAGMLNISAGAVSKWYAPLERGGCGGLIPTTRYIPVLCRAAHAMKKFLEPNMFFTGHT